ncbi:MAG: RsmB/NOP family class I SAM-dependent RNA methyltransferase [Alphaproteobacteria bacterium]|nr:RsmB/NOP family class I SAM-dependent RNA methyltransferase [Alphaproteobacteria bacterium]
MQQAARISAAIELLGSIVDSWQQERGAPADKLCEAYFKERRYIGSHDRGAIAELVYWCLRHKAVLQWWCERLHAVAGARSYVMAALLLRRDAEPAQLATIFSGGKYAPPPLTETEWQWAHQLGRQEIYHPDMPDAVRLNYPQWLEPKLKASLGSALAGEMKASNHQAPLDLRTNTLLITRDELVARLREEGFDAIPAPISPIGIRLRQRQPVFTSPLFREGLFEVQDEGSQVVSQLVTARAGMKVIDFCAGAGGKTLAVAANMDNKGRLLAWDISAKRLSQLPQRLRRAQVFNAEWRVLTSERDSYIKRHKASADRVLTDVPCSGSGTWRRNPDLKWRFTPRDLEEVLAIQQRILESAARLVKPGGQLVYATCSLLKDENEQQVANFLEAHANFRVVCAQKVWNKTASADAASSEVSYLWLTPQQDGCDGFFAAILERQAS